MRRHVDFSTPNEFTTYDVIEFTSNSGDKVAISASAFIALADKVNWDEKITLIKILRGLIYCTPATSSAMEHLSLRFAKDIVEYMILHYRAVARFSTDRY